jgi:hypothetical protein
MTAAFPAEDGLLRVETQSVPANWRADDAGGLQPRMSGRLLAAALITRYPNGLTNAPHFYPVRVIECDNRASANISIYTFPNLRLLFPAIQQLIIIQDPTKPHSPFWASARSRDGTFASDSLFVEIRGDPPQSQAESPDLPARADDLFSAIRDLGDFPAVPFLVEFLGECAQPDGLAAVDRFYCESAVFSLTCDHTIPYFEQFSRNLFEARYADRNPRQNFAYGARAVRDAQSAIFAGRFPARVLFVQAEAIGEALYAVVLHGLFVAPGNVCLGFDRALVIRGEEDGGVILNDQMHVRELAASGNPQASGETRLRSALEE